MVFVVSQVLLFLLLGGVASENILFFHHVATYSHLVQTWPLAEALSERGHTITYISSFYYKQSNANITEVVPKDLTEYANRVLGEEFDINLRVRREVQPLMQVIMEMGRDACKAVYDSPEFKNWMESNSKVDLVIIDGSLPECGTALAHKLTSKYIIFAPVVSVAYEYDAYGYLPESSSIPEMEVDAPFVPMGFLDRVSNTIMSLRWTYAHYKYCQDLDMYLKIALQVQNMPPVRELLRNVSLIFYPGDVVTNHPRTLPPLYVNVAGIQCQPSTKKPLPQKIESFLNSTENDGFIYISMGSLAIPANFPDFIKNAFFESIQSHPRIKFLWRWHGPKPSVIPDNLLVDDWFPQNDLLVHPKILGFITQGGRPSTVEAVYHGVPTIALPIQGDQDPNSRRVNEMGGNILLEITTLTVDQMTKAIEKLAYDPELTIRMTTLQQLFRDRQATPLQTAVWWTEYVLRMKDTSHLRPSGSNQHWFQRRLLDVWLFLFNIVLLTIVMLILCFVRVINNCKFHSVRQQKRKLQ